MYHLTFSEYTDRARQWLFLLSCIRCSAKQSHVHRLFFSLSYFLREKHQRKRGAVLPGAAELPVCLPNTGVLNLEADRTFASERRCFTFIPGKRQNLVLGCLFRWRNSQTFVLSLLLLLFVGQETLATSCSSLCSHVRRGIVLF